MVAAFGAGALDAADEHRCGVRCADEEPTAVGELGAEAVDGDQAFVGVLHAQVADPDRALGGHQVKFGHGIRFSVHLAARDVMTDTRARFVFLPDGSTRGGHLDIVGFGRTHRIEVDWLTGVVRLRLPDRAP